MCRPFSCVVKSDLSVLIGKSIAHHSHSEIIQDAALTAEISVNQYAKVELLPPDKQYASDVEGWELKLDEERTPEWWEENLPEIDARVRDAAQKWQNKLRVLKKWTVEEGEYLIVIGSGATITQDSGYLYTYGNSQNTITQNGGELSTYDNSQNIIIQNAGYLYTSNNSQNTITLNSGWLRTHDNSQNTITQNGGALYIFNNAQNTVTQNSGFLWTYNNSQNTITQNGGELYTYNNAQNTVVTKMTAGNN